MGTAYVTERADGSIKIRFPFNQWIIDQIKLHVPSIDREYDPQTKSWTVDQDYARLVIGFLDNVFTDVQIIREKTQREQQTTPPSPPRGPYADLHLLPTAPPELVTVAYRCLAKLYHPDRGGSVIDMQRLNVAMSLIQNGRV